MIIYEQSGVIPYRFTNGDIEIMLITNRKGKRWVIPKGIVEPDMTPQESALEEAWEEAGIEGELSFDAIGEYRYEKWGGVCRVEVFLLQVHVLAYDWLESFRAREWFTVEQAAKRVREKGLKQIIRDLPTLIDR